MRTTTANLRAADSSVGETIKVYFHFYTCTHTHIDTYIRASSLRATPCFQSSACYLKSVTLLGQTDTHKHTETFKHTYLTFVSKTRLSFPLFIFFFLFSHMLLRHSHILYIIYITVDTYTRRDLFPLALVSYSFIVKIANPAEKARSAR